MTSLVVRALVKVREWLGLNDPAENHLHASHGWLLPPLPVRDEPAPVPVPAVAAPRK